MKMCDLPKDIAEEVLCRIPVTSLRPVRSTCKKWNRLSRCGGFAKKHLAHQARVAEEAKDDTLVVMMMDYRVFLMRFNLSNVKKLRVEREARLIGPDGSDQIDVCEIFHCDGLLLCIPKDNSRIVVWNPYWGQTRWIEQTHNCNARDNYTYALGYDTSNKSHKVLRFSDFLASFVEFKIYDLSCDSWRIILDHHPPRDNDWMIRHGERGLSLKGNTYWFATYTEYEDYCFLVCFDFTRETFGPPLPLPFESNFQDLVSLSSVREDQLVVLFQRWDMMTLEIWISTKIDEPNAVSWNNKVFLSADIRKLIHPQWLFPISAGFFIDEEKKVAVVFDKDTDIEKPTREVAYIIGVDGSLKEAADVRECADYIYTAFVCSYVPSLVQLN